MQSHDTSEAVEAFRLYTQAFQSLDPRAVARHFHEPALSITPQGVSALPTRAAVVQAYERVMADLPARGFALTEFSPLTGRRLADDLAVVTCSAVWKTSSGADLMRFGMSFTLRHATNEWLIVVAGIHDADAKP
ncbi:MAG TPA: DUF4440 domain-containing protein [Kofleriaceae bacterium]|nr:DUF4440 domain-containing protein [Kofleriaceae bacterium]